MEILIQRVLGKFSKKKRIRIDYSEDEKKNLFDHFNEYIENGKLPPPGELEDYLQTLDDTNRYKIAGLEKTRECIRNYVRKCCTADDEP